MKPNLHGSFPSKNDDGLLGLSTVKANGYQTAFGNVRNDAFTIAVIVVSKLHVIRASVPAFRSSCYASIHAHFTNFGKSWALANLVIPVPLFYLTFLEKIRRL